MAAIPSTATAAIPTSSGRILLWDPGSKELVSLMVRGPGPWGVGVGLPPQMRIVDPNVLEESTGSGKTATSSQAQHNLLSASAALALMLDMKLATAHTIKNKMLSESVAAGMFTSTSNPTHTQNLNIALHLAIVRYLTGVTSVRSTLAHPGIGTLIIVSKLFNHITCSYYIAIFMYIHKMSIFHTQSANLA